MAFSSRRSSMSSVGVQAAKACDTVPAPQNLALARGSATPPSSSTPAIPVDLSFDQPETTPMPMDQPTAPVPTLAPFSNPQARKLCVRHQRMADEGTSLKLQQSLDALPLAERESVNAIWSNFSSSSHARRELILQGLLTMCCFSQLSLLSQELSNLIRLDPFSVFPREVSLRVLGYLDAMSLGKAAQVSATWRGLADDNILWKSICEQHIDKKCTKCGWGLPLLDSRRTVRPLIQQPPSPTHSSSSRGSRSPKRSLEEDEDDISSERPAKRQRHDPLAASSATSFSPLLGSLDSRESTPSPQPAVTRPWKDIYCERLTIERNWRRGRCTVRTLTGHTDGVMCMQFKENMSHPSFPVLITGSYDRTVRIWNLDTGKEVSCLRGHHRAVRALQFDERKLITGSMDHTLKVWNWRTGACIRTLEGHTEGVVALNYDSNVLASGSVDTTVKIWNFRNGDCFTLRGHLDWVNAVTLWDGRNSTCSLAPDPDLPLPDLDPGKMLFSASDDGTIRLWDLNLRTCVRQFLGHVGQVQSIKLIIVDKDQDETEDDEMDSGNPSSSHHQHHHVTISPVPGTSSSSAASHPVPFNHPYHTLPSGMPGLAPASVSVPTIQPPNHPGFDSAAFVPPPGFDPTAYRTSPGETPLARSWVHDNPASSRHNHAGSSKGKGKGKSQLALATESRGPRPVLISGSLDNTIKMWDVTSGKPLKTFFGHIEGVWSVASDKLRLVSGSHDRTVKIWERDEGRCVATLVGHRGAVTCLALGDDKIVTGSDDHDVRVWSFGV